MNKTIPIALAIFAILGALLFGILIFFVVPRADATAIPANTNLDAATMLVAKGLYCPVCPGTPLDACGTQACTQWRALIKQKLGAGETPAQIQAYFVEQYGERVLGAPRAQGLNIFIYLLPAFAVSGGAALLYLFAEHRIRAGSPLVPAPTPAQNEYRSRIEQELKEND